MSAQAPSEDEPVDGTVPSTVPPFYNDYESMCPGLDLKPELIPPHFETRIGLIPDPEPYEICLLLAEAAVGSVPGRCPLDVSSRSRDSDVQHLQQLAGLGRGQLDAFWQPDVGIIG